MTRNRQIAGLLWAAIALIAVQFVPVAAHAHGGHSHGAVSVSDQAQDTAGQHKSEPAPAGAQVASQSVASQSVAEQSVASQSLDRGFGDISGSSGPCPGGCCGQGMPCCGALCAADWYDHAPFSPRALATPWPVATDLSGLDPEALPEPPKFLV